jgi:predicted permease
MASLIHTVRLGVRSLLRTPGFALTACLTLAVGIGLSTAVFTVADALLLRQLPVLDQDRIVVLSGQTRDRQIENWPLGFENASQFTDRARAMSQLAFFGYEGAAAQTLRDGDRTTTLQRALVSGDFFEVLGAQPVLGRPLREDDDARGTEPVAVLSYSAWQEQFGGSMDVLGRRITLHEAGVTYTVAGVMPRGLDYPRGVDFWATIVPSTAEEILAVLAYYPIGRLAPGSSPVDAGNELTEFFQRDDAPAGQPDLEGAARTLPELVMGDTRPAILAFSAASALLLLITCINVANLLLVRGIARMREISVRAAMGAGRGRVVAQLLTENAILAVIGGALGLLLAAVAVRGFVALAPAELPRVDEIHLSTPALAGAIGITGLAMLLFGLAPAILTSRVELQQVLRSGARQSASRRSRLASEGLVAVQVALAVLVLSAAGLIGRSLIALERAELAFDPARLLIAELALRSDQYDTAPKQLAVLEQLLPAIEAIPGVGAVTPVVAVPFSGTHGWDGRPSAEGQSAEEGAANPLLNMEVVAPSYFATIGAPILRGRGFADGDREGAPPVVVLSESAARHYWPGDNPIGKRLTMGRGGNTVTVVGIVPDTRYRDLREARPSIYFPMRQSFFPFAPTNLVIRTERTHGLVVPALRRVLEQSAPGVTLASAAPFDEFLAKPLAQPRLNALLLAAFAAAAVILAAIGLFGILSTMVRQRTREFGVRLALGATAARISRMVLRRGMIVAGIGVVAGLLGALIANRLLSALLFEVSPTDPATLGGIVVLLLAVAAMASLIPARTSTRIEPVTALKTE